MADSRIQDLVERLQRREISSKEFQDAVRTVLGADPLDLVVFRGVPSEGLNLGSWSGADEARFQELLALPKQTPQTRAEGQQLWERKRTAGGQFFSDTPEVALQYAKNTGSIHAMKLRPDEVGEWAMGMQNTPGGLSSNFQIPNESLQAAQGEGRLTSGRTNRVDPTTQPGAAGVFARQRARAAGSPLREAREAVSKKMFGPSWERLEAEGKEVQALDNEIIDQKARLGGVPSDSYQASQARRRIAAAQRALWGLGRIAGVAGTAYEAGRIGGEVGRHGPVEGAQRYAGTLGKEFGELAQMPEQFAERIPGYGEQGVNLPAAVLGIGGRRLAAAGRALRGESAPFEAGKAIAEAQARGENPGLEDIDLGLEEESPNLPKRRQDAARRALLSQGETEGGSL